jgi:hypothetical protein
VIGVLIALPPIPAVAAIVTASVAGSVIRLLIAYPSSQNQQCIVLSVLAGEIYCFQIACRVIPSTFFSLHLFACAGGFLPG